jgi:hypothetical protein
MLDGKKTLLTAWFDDIICRTCQAISMNDDEANNRVCQAFKQFKRLKKG